MIVGLWPGVGRAGRGSRDRALVYVERSEKVKKAEQGEVTGDELR